MWGTPHFLGWGICEVSFFQTTGSTEDIINSQREVKTSSRQFRNSLLECQRSAGYHE